MVAKGFRDKTRYEIDQTYSPVAQGWMVKWLLSVANKNDWFLAQSDVKTAFLYSDIKNPVYLSMHDGLKSENNKNLVLMLQKSLYGLKIKHPRKTGLIG